MRSAALGRWTAACLALLAVVPASSMGASDHYFDGNLLSGQAYASGSAHTGVYFSNGQANHNAFCAGVIQGVGGLHSSAVVWPIAPACSSSGGYAAQSYGSGLSGYYHGRVATNFGHSFIWDFTGETHYSW